MDKIAIPVGGTTTNIPNAECFNCLAKIEQATGAKGQRPHPGDVTVCTNCGAISKFGEKMELLPVTDDDLEAMPKMKREHLLALSKTFKKMSQAMFEGRARIAVIGVPSDLIGRKKKPKK